jgi:hypothetical protein
MGRNYLLVKVTAAGREPIDSFTADGAREADEAVAWMKARHAGAEAYSLAEGEFFELVEEGLASEEEWRSAMAALDRKRAGKPGR